MGSKLSKENLQLKELMARFDELQRIPQRNISFLEDKDTHKQFVLKETTFNDQKEFNRNVQRLLSKKAALEGQPHVVQLSEYLVRTEDQYCSTFYKIYALFEYPYKTLEDEIHERQLQHRRFLEKQLWSILASCILGLSHLQKFEIRHQALKSSSILLTNDGLIKVADPYCTSQPSNYEVLLTKRNTPHIYISPELCESLSQELTSPQLLNPYRSDVFTVAMIMLEAGLLQYQDQCYRDECARVHWDTLQYNLDRFGEGYSPELKSTLESMLQQAQEDRPEWTDLEAHVKIGEETDIDHTRVQTPMSKQREQSRPAHPSRGQSNISSAQPTNQIGMSAGSNVSGNQPAGPAQLEVSPQSVATTVVQQASLQPGVATQQGHRPGINQTIPNSQRSNSQQPPVPQQMYVTQPVHNQQVSSNFQPAYHSQLPQQQPAQQQPLVNPIPTMKRTQVPLQVTPTVLDELNPIHPPKPSSLDTIRPTFSLSPLPNVTYSTLVKNDENLVEVYESNEEEQQSSVRIQEPPKQQQLDRNDLRSPTTTTVPIVQQHGNPGSTLSNRQGGMTISMGKVTPSAAVNNNTQTLSVQSPVQQGILSSTTSMQSTSPNQLYFNQQQPQPWQPIAGTAVIPPSSGTNSYRSSNPLLTQGLPSNVTAISGISSFQPSTFVGSGLTQYPSSLPNSSLNNYIPSANSFATTNNYSLGTYHYQAPTFNYTPSSATQQIAVPQYYQPPPQIAAHLSKTANFGFDQTGPAPKTFTTDRSSKPSKDFDAEPPKSHRTFVIEIFKQGSKYEGDKLNDMRDGRGKFYYQDGGLYDGEWRENKMSGHGKLFYQSGKIAYDGEWSNDQFTGFGVLYNEEPVILHRPFDQNNLDDIDEYWTRFEGDFFDDLKHGNGKLYLSNNEWFEGQFDRDVASGPGTFHTMHGEVIEGIWSNNQLERRIN